MLGTTWGAFAASWADLMGRALIEGSVVLLIVAALWWPIRHRAPAQLGYGLFTLVLLKLVLPLQVTLPGSMARWLPGYHVDHAWSGVRTGAEPLTTIPLAPATALSTSAVTEAWTLETYLLFAWAAVVSVLLCRFAAAQLDMSRALRRAEPLDPAVLPVDISALCTRLRIRRQVAVCETDAVDSPAVAGLVHPRVLLPRGLRHHLTPARLEWILLHELAHIRRGDLWVSLAQRLVQMVFFFHPAVWIANRVVDDQREFACDDVALAAASLGRRECGAGFVQTVEWTLNRRPVPAGAATLGMFDRKHISRRRLMRILDPRRRPARRSSLTTAAAVCAVGLFVLPTAEIVRAQEPATPKRTARELRALERRLDRLEEENQQLRAQLQRLEQRRAPARRSAPNPLPAAAPEPRPAPDSRFAPLPRPAPEARPAPDARPLPAARSAPEARPLPDARSAPEAKPLPDARPAPEARPLPDARPATAPEPHSGRRRPTGPLTPITPATPANPLSPAPVAAPPSPLPRQPKAPPPRKAPRPDPLLAPTPPDVAPPPGPARRPAPKAKIAQAPAVSPPAPRGR